MATIKLERVIGAPKSGGLGTLKVDWPMARAMVSRIANEELAEVQKQGFPKKKDEYTIRQRGRVLREVTPRNVRIGPMIRYVAVGEGGFREASINMIKIIMRKVPFAPKTASAKRSGQRWRGVHYRDAFQLKEGGSVVVPAGPKFERRAIRWLEGNADRVQATNGSLAVVNTMPYALRLENGWSMQTPSGVLERALKRARSSKDTKIALNLPKSIGYEQAPKSAGGVVRTFIEKDTGKKRVSVVPVLKWSSAA